MSQGSVIYIQGLTSNVRTKSGFKGRCLTIIMGVRTLIYRHIQTYPDISRLDIRISGYPDIQPLDIRTPGQIQTNPDKSRRFRQPFRGEVYMLSENQQERAKNTPRTSQDRAKTEQNTPPYPPPSLRHPSDGPSSSDSRVGSSSRSLALSSS